MVFQMKMAQANGFRQPLRLDRLNSITRALFKILTHDNVNKRLDDNKLFENTEIQHLEDCANATRGTEAYDQYEWLDSDE